MAELALLAAYRGKGCPFLERPLRCRVTRVLARAQDYVCGSYSVSGGKGYLLPDSYVPHRVPVSTKATRPLPGGRQDIRADLQI